MDAFKLRNKIVADYSSYIKSFLNILDPRINKFVHDELARGVLWPEPLLQLSPAYQPAQTIKQLAEQKVLHPLCAEIFQAGKESLQLHQHQRTALDIASKGNNYVVTTGTGSGKSMAYILPIFDYILKHNPEQARVRAIIVYPMNALINSQEQALDRFVENLPGGADSCPVKYARYTGQESNERKRQIQQNPPHILLTNYVMLELMLTRPEESGFVNATASALQFLVLDELHTYRGRQGADVAYLVRRLRERCGNPRLQCIGTSATMSAGSTRIERNQEIASVASRIFGGLVEPTDVIDETLRRILTTEKSTFNSSTQIDNTTLKAAISSQTALPTNSSWENFRQHPLAIWIEEKFGLETDTDGKLKRPLPITLWEGAIELESKTGIDPQTCATRLRQIFNWGAKVRNPEGLPGFAFKLHQFFSQGDSVYATIEAPEARYLTLNGQVFTPGQNENLLFPLVFCRECGQEHYLCSYNYAFQRVIPRPPVSRELSNRRDEIDGYLLVDTVGFWSDENIELLPDTWFKELKSGRRLKPEYEKYRPRLLWMSADGTVCTNEATGTTPCWFIPFPFMTCLRCGEVYTRKQGEFSKLARLSSEGRSTSTTLLALSSILQMKNDPDLKPDTHKLLSFTDNRQDASLQAGHFNDFIEVTELRSAIYRALQKATEGLGHAKIASAVVDELNLPEEAFAKMAAPNPRAPLARRNRQALQNLVEYRIYEDLRRGWRFLQPNLEQCGLLTLDYDGLEALSQDEPSWQEHDLMGRASVETRLTVVRAFLDYMRRELAVSAECLDFMHQMELVKDVNNTLNEKWKFGENERLYNSTRYVLPGTSVDNPDERSLSANTAIGRYLKSAATWGQAILSRNLDTEEYRQLITKLIEILQGWGFLIDVDAAQGKHKAVQIRSDCLIWRASDGKSISRDQVRRRRMLTEDEGTAKPNNYFAQLYKNNGDNFHKIEGREHTGQVQQSDRQEREKRFRDGDLAALFCSPTMELGIDIATLNMVHLRNVPPTPANYAQRSGRAGRSGTPALVATYCSVGSGHDQYFFRQPYKMVSGVVVPPRLDLTNEELIRAHIHAVWLSLTGLGLGRSLLELINTDNPADNYPLQEQIKQAIELNPQQQEECFKSCQRILASSFSASQTVTTVTINDETLRKIISDAPMEFDRACERWRTLYDTAERQLTDARHTIDQRFRVRNATTSAEVDEAERREREAKRQKKLLCNDSDDEQGDTDFNPYRYFASEGFLPGYNFPRLPVQAFLPTGYDKGTFLARPRFLAITEFGPHNIIYHEGGKYQVTRVSLPAGGVESRLVPAKLCYNCGYFHEGNGAMQLDVCECCGVRLNSDNSLTTRHLFEMTTVTTQRMERITSEEEERTREGFFTTLHYRWTQAHPPLEAQVKAQDGEGDLLVELQYAPAATLWRINHRRRRAKTDGFTLDTKRGLWAKKPDEEQDNPTALIASEPAQTLSGIRLMVRDTRNILLLMPQSGLTRSNLDDEAQLASLQFALQRGIEAIYQVEEQELASERIGEGGNKRILLWEAAEGGVGVLTRIARDEKALAEIARAALEICHFDPATGQDITGREQDCGKACYRCLLSYSNQSDHTRLNRHVILDTLLELANSRTIQGYVPQLLVVQASSKEAEITSEDRSTNTDDTDESFAQKVLLFLKSRGRKLPDALRPVLHDSELRPDFFYEKGAVCVFCDEGEPVAAVRSARSELDDNGYRVVVLKIGRDLEEQLKRWPDLF